MGLTHIQLRDAKPGEKPYKMYDSGGLYAIVATSGSKLWRFDYRFLGLRKTMSLGTWPGVTLARARELRDVARDTVDHGHDPAIKKAVEVIPAVSIADTFETVARDWFATKTSGWVSSYSTRIMSRLEGDIFPALGSRPITDIEPPELLAAIRKIEDRGAIELAKRVKNYCGEVFQFGIAEGKCARDPSRDIQKALKPKPRTVHRAALRLSDMAEFVRGVESFREDTLAVLALKLTLQTVVRTNEIRFAAWDEFEGDVWRIPAGRMKEGLEHIVPLSRQTLMLLQEIPRRGALLFAKDTKSGVISQNAMISICYRLGYMSKMTVHGIRRTFSTAANESGLWQPDAVERQLAHVEQNDVRRAYNAAEYMDERRRLVQWWNDTLFPEWGDMLG